MQGKVRIIAGQWRGRQLPVLDKPGLRPTSDRIRETLFNWLNFRLPQSRCLDLFAGSGVLGMEAASRGAKEVVLVEREKDIVQTLRAQTVKFSAHQVKVIQADALQFLKKPSSRFDMIFLDPPFKLHLLNPCCLLLEQQGWLSSSAHIYLETEKNHLSELIVPPQWKIIRTLQAGQVAYLLAIRE